LERLLALLAELGGSPHLVEQTRVEPTQDMAWPARPVRIGPPAPRAGEEEAWLDRPLRELRGRSPREAVTGRRERDLLEAMLRQFEYDASAGPTGPDCDLGLLRARLNMLVD
jgi:hypothetical protein